MHNPLITAEIPVTTSLKKLARIEVLDVLRGFALLGIFLMNIEYFNRPIQEFGLGIPAGTVGLDYAVARLTEIFVTGKFWILFSMLFGMGFVVMQTQLTQDGRPFETIYLRRTAALMVFGLLHTAFLWPGDILHSYALVAFVFMWLPMISVPANAFLGTGFYYAPAFLLLLSGLMSSSMTTDQMAAATKDSADTAELALQAARAYSTGDYWRITQQRWQDFMTMLNYETFVFIGALGIFLIGAGIMRSGRLLDLTGNRSFFLKAMAINATIAVLFIGSAQLFAGNDSSDDQGTIADALMMFGNLPLSLFYLCTIALAMSTPLGGKILGLLAPAGKMALTNYLMQSLIASWVFYGYGLGLWAQWGRAHLALFVILVYIAQVVCSHVWLRYFRYGPMEWFWRALTYWSLPTMRVDASHALN